MLDPVAFGKSMGDLIKKEISPILKRIEELESRTPEKGDPGRDAEPVDEKTIADNVIANLLASDRLTTLIDMQMSKSVAEYLSENPAANGKDGAGIADLIIDRDGNLIATFTDGRMKSLGSVIGRDGADFTDADIDWDGERTLIVRGKGGEIRKTLPVPIDRGYWREGMACEKGDIVTHDGNAWAALRDNKAKPCHENKEDWRLFARKGRDGRDGKDGKPPPGPVRLRGDEDA